MKNIVDSKMIGGHLVETIETGRSNDGYSEGYVAVNGVAQYDYEINPAGQIRTCGYGDGCFWSDWQ